MSPFSAEQIAQMAPDAASLRAGRDLANERKWLGCFFNDRALWGEVQGSAKEPYRTQIDLRSIAYSCTCPSRKFPCKHSLGLMFLFTAKPQVFKAATSEPAWVAAWLQKRADQPASVEAEAPAPDKRDRDKNKREDDRMALVQAGAAELDLMLRDLLRAGFLTIPEKGPAFFNHVVRRMIDAKAPGLANLVRNFAKMDFTQNTDWHSAALENAVKTWVLLQGFNRIDQLEAPMREHIRSLIGWNRNKKEMLDDPQLERVQDDWLALGKITELLDDNLMMQRIWLYGCKTGRTALLVEYAPQNMHLPVPVPPGMVTRAELVYYPSPWPERALVRNQDGSAAVVPFISGALPDWAAAQQQLAEVLGQSPWADGIVQHISGLSLTTDQRTWWLKDRAGALVEIDPVFNENKIWKALAVSGGNAMTLFLLRTGSRALPLGTIQHTNYHPF
jgi:hypothetical protein